MKRLVEFPAENGEVILVEVDEAPRSGAVTRGLSPSAAIERARLTLEEALDKAQPVATALVNKLKQLEPDEATIEFGLALSAEAGAILASTGSAVHYRVTLTWRKRENNK